MLASVIFVTHSLKHRDLHLHLFVIHEKAKVLIEIIAVRKIKTTSPETSNSKKLMITHK